MALGNNLKRIKKDSLIPLKKEKTAKNKPKPKKKMSDKKVRTTKIKPKQKPNVKAKPIASTKKAVSKPITTSNKPTEIANLNERVLVGGKKDSTISIKLIPSRRKTVRKTKLIIEGSISLPEAEILKDCLQTTFKDYDIIDIQLINITHVDIIPIQLFKMFINFYTDKKVKIDSDVPFDMKIIIERAGFGSLMFKEEAA
ncbi:hypothetical protein MNBD_BACTEROID06-1247 [hydrothermal vent metagenome]|uniref:Uncharacterized protein n=1 Tax=hydrothermal vent metagenome TaxID=652676 RepID=A0A3B0UQD7_9ZZZZ